MTPAYNSPGVYRQEMVVKPPPVLQTGVPAFVGFAGPPADGGLGKSPVLAEPGSPPVVTADTTAGALAAGTYYVAFTYFGDSGETLASPETVVALPSPGSLVVAAPAEQPPSASGYNVYAGIESGRLAFQGAAPARPGSWTGFVIAAPLQTGAVNRPLLLYEKQDFLAFFSSLAGGYLETAVNGFFDNGGVRCYVVIADPAGDPVAALRTAIGSLGAVDDLDLVAVPDAYTLRTFAGLLDKDAVSQVQSELLLHCAQAGNRFAILDSLPGANVDDVMDQAARLLLGQPTPVNGALYYPWLIESAGAGPVPPCGHVAGIYARSDGRSGVAKAPANEEIYGVLDLETQIDTGIQDRLNPARINCLRAFPGRGIRVWGARTLGAPLRPADPWLYVGVRRLFLTLRRWIDLNLQWASFEPNDGRLWVRLQRELGVYLTKVFRAGALQGASPAEAFFVKCDGENNPPELRDTGEVVIEIGLAPLAPAEFIVVRITQRAGATADN